MADNYLENRYEEVFGGHGVAKAGRRMQGLESLLKKNRSYREYDTSYIVTMRQLEAIVRVNQWVASGRNKQTLRFKLLTTENGSQRLQGLYHLGRALPELHLPRAGAEPEAFIVVCSTDKEWKNIDIDLGISCQSMTLKAAEMGLQAVVICNFNPEEVKAALELPLTPLAMVAFGKGVEKIEMVEVPAETDYNYYRRDGVHYVPKYRIGDLLL